VSRRLVASQHARVPERFRANAPLALSTGVSAALALLFVVQAPLLERHRYGADVERASGMLAAALAQDDRARVLSGNTTRGATAYYLQRLGVPLDRFLSIIYRDPRVPETSRVYIVTEIGRRNALNNTALARATGITLTEWTTPTLLAKFPNAAIWSMDRRDVVASQAVRLSQ
jgi:hypothetical protein